MKHKIYKLGELFCGPGGIALGAKNATLSVGDTKYCIKHVWASDYHPETCQTYQHNFPDVKVLCDDVKVLDIASLGDIDGFAYGFPCNDFSIAGESKGFDGEFGGLYKYGIKVIDKYNPSFFIAENVGGLASANEGNAIKKIIKDLAQAGNDGYELTVHKYKFEHYGIPQSRHRIIIVGVNKSLKKKFRVPAPTHKDNFLSVKDVFENPPIPSDSKNHELTAQSKIVIERLNHIKPGKNIWQTELPEHLKLNVKGAKLSQIYKRLHPDKPSYTITGSGGGGTHGYHYSEPRALTNRERARIQTFPDDFYFIGKKESVRRQIGMAVSPVMAKIIFEAILKTLAEIDYPAVEPSYI